MDRRVSGQRGHKPSLFMRGWARLSSWRQKVSTDTLDKCCCGATLDDKEKQKCGCNNTPTHLNYFLRPLLPSAYRVLLPFESGHWRVQIGRGVPARREARLQHKRYKSIGRHHANIEINPQSEELIISPAKSHYEIAVNDEPIYGPKPVQIGDIIKLSDVEFILEAADDEVLLAYLISIEKPDLKYRLLFSRRQRERSIGRAKNNDVVLPPNWIGISEKQVTMIYEPKTNTLYIYNDSTQKGTLHVHGNMMIGPKQNYKLFHRETPLRLDQHDFLFIQVPYDPNANQGEA